MTNNRGVISLISSVALVGIVIVSGLSTYSWYQSKRISSLRNEIEACELVANSYRNAMESAKNSIEQQNIGIAALSKQQYDRERAIEKVLADGKKRQEELEAKLRSMKAEKQSDPDPCVAACQYLRSPLR